MPVYKMRVGPASDGDRELIWHVITETEAVLCGAQVRPADTVPERYCEACLAVVGDHRRKTATASHAVKMAPASPDPSTAS